MKGISKKSIRNTLAILLCVVTVMLSFCSCSSDKNAEKEAESNNNSSAAETIGSGKALHLNDYLSDVKYFTEYGEDLTAYSGIASAEIEFNYMELKADISEKGLRNFFKKVRSYDDEQTDYRIESTNIDDIFEVRLKEEYKNLSNGDIITVEITNRQPYEDMETILEALGISIEKEIDITVEGLETAKEIDLIGEAEKYIVYEGANGNGEASFDFYSVTEPIIIEDKFYLTRSSSNSFNIVCDNKDIGTVFYYFTETDEMGHVDRFSNQTDITEGDVLNVRIYEGGSLIGNLIGLGYVPKDFEREITVPDLGNYVTSKSDLTEADINGIKQYVTDKLTAKYDGVEICSAHFGNINPGIACDEDEKVEIYVVYGKNFFSSKSYYCYVINSISKNKAGELRYETLDEDYGYQNSAANMEANLNADYSYEKLF